MIGGAIIVEHNGKIVFQHDGQHGQSHNVPLDVSMPVVMFAAGDGRCGKRE
jgi:hypothetical protein